MLVIRLSRVGRKKLPVYRVVAQDSREHPSGKITAFLGTYNPHTKEVELQTEDIERMIGNGAQPSQRVARLLQKAGVKLPDWVVIEDKNKKPKNAPEEEEAKPEEAAPAAEAEEQPAEETEAKDEAKEEPKNEDKAEEKTEDKAEEPAKEEAEKSEDDK